MSAGELCTGCGHLNELHSDDGRGWRCTFEDCQCYEGELPAEAPVAAAPPWDGGGGQYRWSARFAAALYWVARCATWAARQLDRCPDCGRFRYSGPVCRKNETEVLAARAALARQP